jgi:hypothetical protein
MFPYPLNMILMLSGSAVGFGILTAVFVYLTWKDRCLPTYGRFNQAFQRKWWIHGGLALMMSLFAAGVGHKSLLLDLFIGVAILLHVGMMIWYFVKPRPVATTPPDI